MHRNTSEGIKTLECIKTLLKLIRRHQHTSEYIRHHCIGLKSFAVILDTGFIEYTDVLNIRRALDKKFGSC